MFDESKGAPGELVEHGVHDDTKGQVKVICPEAWIKENLAVFITKEQETSA